MKGWWGPWVPPSQLASDVDHVFLDAPTPENVEALRSEYKVLKAIVWNSPDLVASARDCERYLAALALDVADLDGVLFHWRAPGFHSHTGKDSERPIAEPIQWAQFVCAARDALGPFKLIGVTLPVLPKQVRRMAAVLDTMRRAATFFVVCGWDGAWGASRAMHASPYVEMEAAYASYARVVAPEKLVLGLAGDGTVYEGCPDGIGGRFVAQRPATEAELALAVDLRVRDVGAGSSPCAQITSDTLVVFEDEISLRVKAAERRSAGTLSFCPPANAPAPNPLLFFRRGKPPAPLLMEDVEEEDEPLAKEVPPPPRTTSLLVHYSPPSQQHLRRRGRHAWSPFDAYTPGDVVTLGRCVFECVAAHAPTFPFATEGKRLWKPLKDKEAAEEDEENEDQRRHLDGHEPIREAL